MLVLLVAVAVGWLAPSALGAQAVQIDAGVVHTCALTTTGGVQCWGYNNAGQLGDGTFARKRARPVNVVGLTSGVTQIATGAAHTCALTTGGGVKCWGVNSLGELGDGTLIERHSPVDVSGLTSGVQAIAAHGDHTCALTGAGEVKCWGSNYEGEIGDGTRQHRSLPTTAAGLPAGVIALDLTYFQSCALLASGSVWCWGDDQYFQVGDGPPASDRLVPTEADELPAAAQVQVGMGFNCVLTSADGVSCLGTNSGGQLGRTGHATASGAQSVAGLSSGVDEITAGYFNTCAILDAGGVRCWGANDWGQLGVPRAGEHQSPFRHRHTPGAVAGLPANIDHVALGWEHSCALTDPGEILCWGRNALSHLGDGGTHSHARPAYVFGYGAAATSTTLTTNRHPAHVGQRVRYSARVSPVPSGGQVHFTDRGKTIKGCNAVPVNSNGVARCFVRWTVAGVQHRIRATFWGHIRFNQSSSGVLLDRVKL